MFHTAQGIQRLLYQLETGTALLIRNETDSTGVSLFHNGARSPLQHAIDLVLVGLV
jgi:hypothetical protein